VLYQPRTGGLPVCIIHMLCFKHSAHVVY